MLWLPAAYTFSPPYLQAHLLRTGNPISCSLYTRSSLQVSLILRESSPSSLSEEKPCMFPLSPHLFPWGFPALLPPLLIWAFALDLSGHSQIQQELSQRELFLGTSRLSPPRLYSSLLPICSPPWFCSMRPSPAAGSSPVSTRHPHLPWASAAGISILTRKVPRCGLCAMQGGSRCFLLPSRDWLFPEVVIAALILLAAPFCCCVSFSAYPPRAVKRVSSKVLARQDLKTRADSQYQPAGRVSRACNPSIGEVETG